MIHLTFQTMLFFEATSNNTKQTN